MIKRVSFEHTTFNELPYKFEAGTPDYVATTGLAKALDYVTFLGLDQIEAHEQRLARHAVECLQQIPDLQLYGPMAFGAEGAGPLSFNVKGIHHLDMGTLLDRLGVAVRTGHHCAEPLMHHLGIDGTVRASFGLYNTIEEVDILAQSIQRVAKMFA